MIARCRLLIIEDEVCLARNIKEYLADAGLEVRLCHDGTGGLHAAHTFRPDIVLLDLQLSDMNGLAVLRQLLVLLPEARVIMLTACDSAQTEAEAIRAGACDYKRKPIALSELRRTVHGVR